jgi:hypothetical protein
MKWSTSLSFTQKHFGLHYGDKRRCPKKRAVRYSLALVVLTVLLIVVAAPYQMTGDAPVQSEPMTQQGTAEQVSKTISGLLAPESKWKRAVLCAR